MQICACYNVIDTRTANNSSTSILGSACSARSPLLERTSAKHSIALVVSLSHANGKSGLALLQDFNALSGATHFLLNRFCSSAERGSGRETGDCDLLNHHINLLTVLRAPNAPHCLF